MTTYGVDIGKPYKVHVYAAGDVILIPAGRYDGQTVVGHHRFANRWIAFAGSTWNWELKRQEELMKWFPESKLKGCQSVPKLTETQRLKSFDCVLSSSEPCR